MLFLVEDEKAMLLATMLTLTVLMMAAAPAMANNENERNAIPTPRVWEKSGSGVGGFEPCWRAD